MADIPVRATESVETEAAAPGADPVTMRLQLDGQVTAAGEFEVMAITAGEGNGWEWQSTALSESLALWDGVECFVDHTWGPHSLRDLAGVLYQPTWDQAQQGVKCKLRAIGPSAAVLQELGRQMLGEGNRPRVGFSADVVFTAQQRKVQKILRVNSVDLVFNPARGGAFLRALNSLEAGGFYLMGEHEEGQAEEVKNSTGKPGTGQTFEAAGKPQSLVGQLQQDMQAMQMLLDVQQQQAQLAAEAEQARMVRAQMCGYLLDSGLAAAKLPQPVTERIRKQFAGKVFEVTELAQAIEEFRTMVSDLSAGSVVQGPGRISGMYSSEDQFSAAIHDLMGAQRPEELAGLKAAKLSGIRELYMLMTGDVDFVGGFDATRAQFATTANLPGVLKNVMNKLIIAEWQELGRSGYRWWEPIVDVEHFTSLQQITGVLVGEVNLLPTVAEGAPYTELAVNDSAEVGAWTKYGGYIGLTLEMFERDETLRLRQYPKKLASAGLRRVSALVSSVFTANAGIGPVMADTKNVFHIDHANLGTVALDSTGWEAAGQAIYNQPMLIAAGGTAPKLALDAKYCLVPRTQRLTAQQILYPSMAHESMFFSENMQKGQMGDVITCPEFTDTNDWAAVADPKLAPGIIIGERYGLLPEIILADAAQNGALFTNDEIRMKARHWLAVFVADYRPLYKANVAG